MSTNQRLRFGRETWLKGTRGTLDAYATDKPYIRDLRYFPDGSLTNRPEWETATVEIPTKFGLTSVVVPCQFYNGSDSSYTEGYLAIDGADAEFIRASDGFALGLDNSITSGVTSRFNSVYRIDSTRFLINGCLVFVRQENASGGPTYTIETQTFDAAIKTRLSLVSWTTHGSTIHQGRAFFWGSGLDGVAAATPTHRVYYSDSVITGGYDAYATMTSASQFFDVDGVVKGCVSVGPNLLIWTEEGRWFMMQGSGDPGNATFSNIGQAKVPADGRWPAMIDRDAVFMASDLTSLCTINGGGMIDDTSLQHLGFGIEYFNYGYDGPSNLQTSSLLNSTLIPYFVDTALHNYNQVWTEEDWNMVTYAQFQLRVDDINNRENLIIYTPGMTTNWQVHIREIGKTAPTGTSDETITGALTLPRLFESTKQIRVKRVVIDCTASSTSTMTVAVEDGNGTSTDLTVGPGSDPFAGLSSSPVRLVYTASPNPYTHFSDVVIDNISGISFEAISVEFEISEGLIQ